MEVLSGCTLVTSPCVNCLYDDTRSLAATDLRYAEIGSEGVCVCEIITCKMERKAEIAGRCLSLIKWTGDSELRRWLALRRVYA